RLAQRYVAVAERTRLDRGLGHRHAARRIHPLFGIHGRLVLAVPGDVEDAAGRGVVRTRAAGDAIEAIGVPGDGDGVAHRHPDVALLFVALDEGDAHDEH